MQIIGRVFARKSTPKNGIKRKPSPPGADAGIPYILAFLFIFPNSLYLFT